jgi:hypothetical protein
MPAVLPPVPLPFLLRVAPADAEAVVVSVDGRPAAGPPFLLLPPPTGSLQVRVGARGFRERQLELFSDDRGRTTEVSLERKQQGTLDVVAPEVAYAEVLIDGRKQRKVTPLQGLALDEGEHHVVVRCPAEVCGEGRALADERVTILPGKATRIEARR